MADQWWVKRGDENFGPVSKSQLDKLVQTGQILPEDQVLRTGDPNWQWAVAVYPELKRNESPPAENTAGEQLPQLQINTEPTSLPYTRRQRNKRNDPNQITLPTVLAVATLVLPVLALSCCCMMGTSNSPSTSSTSPSKTGAWVMAQSFVKDSLKSPSTASFGKVFSGDYQSADDVVSVLGGGKFRVVAWVDSENSFGATIRTNFICELEYVGNEKWRCTNLVFLER